MSPHSGKASYLALEQNRERTGRRLVRQRLLRKTGQADHLYRKPSPGRYTTCSFLDDSSTVLAIDAYGFLDVIRLHSSSVSEEYCDKGGSRRTRRLSSLRLTGGMPSSPLLNSDITSSKHAIHCHEKSFAVGLPNGNLHLYDTEYGVATSAHYRLGPKNVASSSGWSLPGRRKALPEISISQRIGSTCPLTDDGNHLDYLVASGWKATRPLRRYRGDQSSWSLYQEFQNPSRATQNASEVFQWNEPEDHIGLMPVCSNSHCSWDFWQANSSLHAVCVGVNGNDYLAATTIDTRQHTSQSAVCFHGEDRKKNSYLFKAACFVSEWQVMTASQEENLNDIELKLWDLRQSRSAVTSERILPSFPRETPLPLMKPVHESRLKRPAAKSLQLTRLQNSQVILSFSANTKKDTTTSPHCVEHHHVLADPSHPGMVDKDYNKRTLVVRQDCRLSPFCINDASQTLASYIIGDDDDIDSCGHIRLDFLDDHFRAKTRGRKRPSSGSSNSSSGMADDQKMMKVDLLDRWETRTHLNSLALNRNGSCLVGTSTDGDLVSWQA